jgi:predicted transcriptional regulator of viral defense system
MCVEEYKKVFDKHNGVIKLSDFTKEGFHNTMLGYLIDKGHVAKIKTGYYEWQYEEPVSDAVIIGKLFPEGIVCLESALYLHGYSDRTPTSWHIAVSKNKTKSKYLIDYPPMKFYFIIDRYLEIGKITILYEGHELSIFDRDRTICDLIRYENKMDKEVFNKAIRAYVADSKKNINRLFEYAKDMNVEKKVRRMIGMWL